MKSCSSWWTGWPPRNRETPGLWLARACVCVCVCSSLWIKVDVFVSACSSSSGIRLPPPPRPRHHPPIDAGNKNGWHCKKRRWFAKEKWRTRAEIHPHRALCRRRSIHRTLCTARVYCFMSFVPSGLNNNLLMISFDRFCVLHLLALFV